MTALSPIPHSHSARIPHAGRGPADPSPPTAGRTANLSLRLSRVSMTADIRCLRARAAWEDARTISGDAQ